MDGTTADPGELVLLANDAMRARNRPRMIALVWAWEAVWAFAIVWPLERLVGHAYGGRPEGDGALFHPGGLELADFIVHARTATPAVVGHLAVLFTAGIVLGLVPLSALIASMAYATRDRRSPSLQKLVPQVAASLKPLAQLLVAAGIIMGLLGAGAVAVGSAIAETWALTWGDFRADQFGIAVAAVLLLLPCFVGILHDMARTAVVRFQVKALRAVALAWQAMVLHPFRDCWSYLWRAGASLALIALGAQVASRLGGRPGAALVALFVMHQLIVASRVALRASWLAKALRSVDDGHRVRRRARAGRHSTPPSVEQGAVEQGAVEQGAVKRQGAQPESDTPAHSDEPAVPILDRGA